MAYTYATLLNEATRWLDAYNDPAFADAFPGFVRQAEERIYTATRIQPYRQSGTFSMPAGEYVFGLPDNFTGAISVAVVGLGGLPVQRVLLQKNLDYLTEVVAHGQQGTPIFYAIKGETPDCVIAPIPPLVCDIVFEYYGKPVSLVDMPAGTTTWVSRNAETTLLQGVLYYAYLYEKGEDDMTTKYLAEFDKGLLLLLNTARGLMRRDDYRASPQAMQE